MKILFLLFISMIILPACTPSQEAIQDAINQTQAALPTSLPTALPIIQPTTAPTSTPVSLSEVDLESILLLPGDLPTEFVAQQIKSNLPDYLKSSSNVAQVKRMGFRTVDFASDGIMIILFNTSEDLEKAYQIIKKEEGLHDVSKSFIDIGEISGYAVTSISDLYLVGGKTIYGGTSIQFIFTRCNALVYIDIFSRANNNETTFTYAQRVDERLSKLICH